MARELKLKLFIEKNTQKVLFAEASNDVVDFLFSLLCLPIGSVTKLLTKESMVGCLDATYDSLERLPNIYFLSSRTKSRLLNPASSKTVSTNSLHLSAGSAPVVTTQKYYHCWKTRDCKPCCRPDSTSIYVTDVCGSTCPLCKGCMSMEVSYTEEEKGFVKDAVTYTITDDLSVSPIMSTTSTITFLSQFSVRDVSCLEEKTVKLGHKEALGLLKASLQSKTVLTDVFLRNIKQRRPCMKKSTAYIG
ncbi:hypothetical protein LUZ62_018118 [Rhynchospora pubera]|uniref:DUF674 domain-containing protein n=1 Tax=Rhynchospora pubera TaxID=906938 RepID=A0AAV8GJN7_9POAL|nr:hypothetical protein LUZ62_018118 [Rhynchospora pubera]